MADEPNIRMLRIIVKDTLVEWKLNQLKGEYTSIIESGDVKLDEEELAKQRIENLGSVLKDLRHVLRQSDPGGGVAKTAVEVANRISEQLGDELYQYLFRLESELDTLYHDNLKRLKHRELDKLRITLEFQGAEAATRMARWPWEYLRSPSRSKVENSGHFLSLEAELMLSRRVSEKAQLLRVPSILKVLLVVSKTKADISVLADATQKKLEELKKSTGAKGGIYKIHLDYMSLIDSRDLKQDYQWQATRKQLEHAVRQNKPHIIHFVGHGRFDDKHSYVDLLGEGGDTDSVNEEEFAAIIKHPDLRLVLVQACESAITDPYRSATGLAQRLANQGIPAVIAMQDKIENTAAEEFAGAFYEALTRTCSIDDAVRAGRKAIQEQCDASMRVAFGVPVLFLESQTGMFSLEEEKIEAGRGSTLVDTTTLILTCPNCQNRIKQDKPNCVNCQISSFACPRCGVSCALTERFCQKCGLGYYCLRCKERMREPNSNYCGACGEPLKQKPYDVAEDKISAKV